MPAGVPSGGVDMPAITGAVLRVYNMGFGDCLLLRIGYDDGTWRSILVDFGSTRPPPGAPADLLDTVAQDIAEQTGGHLEVVVVSHRHTGHVNGFGGVRSGRVIADLEPDLVVRPWPDDPDLLGGDPADHRVRFARGLEAMQRFAAGLRLDDLIRRSRLPEDTGVQLKFLCDNTIGDAAAEAALAVLGRRRQYVGFGDRIDVTDLLPGVEIEILGAPTLDQAPQLAGHAITLSQWGTDGSEEHDRSALFPRAVLPTVPVGVDWLIPKIDRVQAAELLDLLRDMDETINNTSVILSIAIGDTVLLFPGDAGIENWSYALFDAPDHDAIRRRLSRTVLYKVGHHGGAEATPKTLWRSITRRRRAGDLISVLSTSDLQGDADAGGELPCRALQTALAQKSKVVSTLAAGPQRHLDVAIPLEPTGAGREKGAPLSGVPLDATGVSGSDERRCLPAGR